MNHPALLTEYTRSEAVAHGLLVDVTEHGALVGFGIPIGITWPVWSACVEWTGAARLRELQAMQLDRLRALLAACMEAARRSTECNAFMSQACTDAGLTFTAACNRENGGRPIALKLMATFAVEDGAAALTIMFPNEF